MLVYLYNIYRGNSATIWNYPSKFEDTALFCLTVIYFINVLNQIVIIVLLGRSLQWRHNEGDGISNHRRIDCLLNR